MTNWSPLPAREQDRVVSGLTMRWHDRVAFALFVGGMVLLPFSTPAGPDSVVVSFGLPLLALLGCTYWAVWCLRPVLQKAHLPAVCCACALLAGLTVSTLNSPDFIPSAARWFPNALGFCVFLYLLSPNLFRLARPASAPRFQVALVVLVTSAAVMSVYSTVTFLVAVGRWGFGTVIQQRSFGGVLALPWGASNVVASALIYPVFFALYLAQDAARSRPRRVVFKGVAVLLCLAIALTLSRGATIATAIGALILGSLSDFRSRLKLVGTIALIACTLVAVDYWIVSQQQLSAGLGQAFLERIQGQDVGTLNSRTELWSEYVGLIGRAPLFGEGYWSSLFLHQSGPHNIVLNTLVQRGLIGFLLSAPIVVYAAWQIGIELFVTPRTRRNPFFVYAAAGGVASMVHLMVEDANFSQQYMVYSWVFLAVIFLARNELRTKGAMAHHASLRAPQRRAVVPRPDALNQ
jgi:O-antigen ligase